MEGGYNMFPKLEIDKQVYKVASSWRSSRPSVRIY